MRKKLTTYRIGINVSQDLTYCYLHMTEAEIDSLDHIDDADYWDHALSDEGRYNASHFGASFSVIHIIELQIPSNMVPPDPDDSDRKNHLHHIEAV